MDISTMEQLFGTTTVAEKSLDLIPEIILLLLIIMIIFISASYLYFLEHNSKIMPISEKFIHVNNYEPVSNSVVLPIESANECDLSLIYLQLLPPSLPSTGMWNVRNIYSTTLNGEHIKSEIVGTKLVLVNQVSAKLPVVTEKHSNIPQQEVITPKKTIYQALVNEFKDDLSRWSANINHTNLTINFQNASFNTGGSILDQQYRAILTEFCPRYINILNKYANNIEAISIDGHSSSEWQSTSQTDAYLHNMLLSQQRTNAVLTYCLRLPTIKPYKNWLHNVLITSGLSSSQLIMEDEIENVQRSRRVEFKIYVH